MAWKQVRIPSNGFTSADPVSDIPADSLITGSKNLMYRGQNELEAVGGFQLTSYGGGAFNRGGDISMRVGKGWAVIGDTLGEGAGNIIEFIGRSLWHVGVGDITVFNPGITAAPQALGNSPLQNNIPQVSVLNAAKNGYEVPVQVGLLQQLEAPIFLVAPVGVLNKLNGTYTIKLTWLRDATGAESLPSPSSNIAQFSNQTGIVQFPTPTNPVGPRDKWRIYGTASGFGAIGGYFFVTEVPERRISTETGAGYAIESDTGFNVFRRNPTVTGFFNSEQIGKRLIFRDVSNAIIHTATITSVITNTFVTKGVTYGDRVTFSPPHSGALSNTTHNWSIDSFITALRQINVEWFDNELGAEQPPTDFFPPASTASFVAALGNVMILLGTEDGNGIAVSVPNFPEAFPPDLRQNLPEPPVGVLSRPQDNFLYVVCENSIHELMRTSSAVSPIAPRGVTDEVGAANQRGACLAGNSIFLFTKSKQAARVLPDGTVDTVFSNRVEAIMKLWDATKVSIMYDERKSYVAYCHGTQMLLYYPAFDYWAPPVETTFINAAGKIFGDIVSGFTLSGIVHVSSYAAGRIVSDLSISAGTPNMFSASAGFLFEDVGKKMTAPFAGPGGTQYVGTIIAFITTSQVIVSPNAGATISGPAGTVGDSFGLFTFDRNVNNFDLSNSCQWTARFAFSDYGLALSPKTVTKAVVGMKSESTQHTLRFFRNFSTISPMGADRNFTTPGGNHIDNIVDCNNGEGQLIAAELSGNESRSKIYFIELSGSNFGIETNFGV